MSQNLSSAAVVIGALRVNYNFWHVFQIGCRVDSTENDTTTATTLYSYPPIITTPLPNPPPARLCSHTCKKPKLDNIEEWRRGDVMQYNNNCYNYACNKATGTYAQPGRAAGQIYTALRARPVLDAAMRDGLEWLGNPAPGEFPKTRACLVALVVERDWDFHWYRLERNGRWTHKMGGFPSTEYDNSGNIITDPRLCDSGDYKFVTFMSYCKKQFDIL